MSPSAIHPAALAIDKLLAECRLERTRGSGPGGQHRNKVETAVRLHHEPTGVLGEASERRSQAENRRVAAHRLRVNLALEVRRPARRPYEPSETWRRRCRGRRLAVNPDHDDFPTLLAEALDVLAEHDMQVAAAAEQLGLSTTQLVRFLTLEPRALAQVNRRRAELDLKPLRG